ncbi:MAG: agmatine deiminase family protein [Phycisphaerae bacterium]
MLMLVMPLVPTLVAVQPEAQVALPLSRQAYYNVQSSWDESTQGPLPRYREGGTPPVDPNQSLLPRVYRRGGIAGPPSAGFLASPPEYAPTAGVIFRYSTGAWPEVVTECVAKLTGDPAHDEIAYVVVSSVSQRSAAQSQFTSAGADLSKVEFIIAPNDSIWLRDYGPHFIWQNDTLAIVDSHYYPNRPLDNFIPTVLAEDYYQTPRHHIGLYYSGGNFLPGSNRSAFITSLINTDNPGFSEEYIADLYREHQGVDNLYVFPRLPASVDGTGHIDMWFSIVNEDTVVISEFLPGENETARTVTSEAARFMEDQLGYNVFRVPDLNAFHPGDPNCHFTYTNSFRVNDRIFIPSYGQGSAVHLERDAQALATWQAAAPEAEIIQIDCYPIIFASGAIHCIMMQVPRYDAPAPSALVTAPNGGEMLTPNMLSDITWSATDNDSIAKIDLYLSTNGGETFDTTIATNQTDDGNYKWSVPEVDSELVYVKVVAEDNDGNVVEDVSDQYFAIQDLTRTVYDFSTNAGVDRWAYGHQTPSWASLGGIRIPAAADTEINVLQSSAYSRIAASDSIGGDTDPNRYRSPIPSGGWENPLSRVFAVQQRGSVLA